MEECIDVAIIGAGPSGSVAAALLTRLGHRVTVLEQSHFPRFSIGESLLPQCMEFIAEAGMMDAVSRETFQFKNGAVFSYQGKFSSFDFSEKTAVGCENTYQVQRSRFDQVLAESAADQGAELRFGHSIKAVSVGEGGAFLNVAESEGQEYRLKAKFLLDASGFGRVLPRMLNLNTPSDFPVRRSVFTHIEDNISATSHDRNKILISIHPQRRDVWFWLIPFSNGRCSVGVVAEEDFFSSLSGSSKEALLKESISGCPELSALLTGSVFDSKTHDLCGYSSNVTSLFGHNFALLGNAGEFLDPVFSSGVTIAMKSASLAAPLVSRTLSGKTVDWQYEYARPLQRGVDTFRAYVNSWYAGSLQDIIFAEAESSTVRKMICSILAGYAWDEGTPFVREPERRLRALAEICATV